jgi:hypothetical protein
MSVEEHATAKYLADVHNGVDLKSLSDELMLGTDQALRSVTWNEKKWMRQ